MPMIDQLVYTWSVKGLNGQPGFGVRAASLGLKDEDSPRYQNLRWCLPYKLPPGLNSGTLTSRDAPMCLALINAGSERILLRKQYVGVDAAGRPGVYLTHLLAGLPADFSAKKAILLWSACESDIWITDRNTPEPRILEQISPERLGKLAQQGWNKFSLTKEREFALREALLHFLQQSPPTRIYLSGDSEDIATVVWGMTQSLPEPMLEGLTFNTYECDLRNSRETVVGLSPYQNVPLLTEGEVRIDLNSAARSSRIMPTREMKEYIDFVIELLHRRINLDSDSSHELDTLIAFAEEKSVNNPNLLLKSFRDYLVAQSSPPPREEPLPPVEPSLADPVQQGRDAPISPSPENPYRFQSVNKKPLSIPVLTLLLTIYRQFQHELAQASHLRLLQRGTRLSLFFNVLLVLCLVGLLIYVPLGQNTSSQNATTRTLAQATQNAQRTSTALNSLLGSQPQLNLLLGGYVSVDPVLNNSDVKVYVVVQNISQSTWSGQQGFYLACMPQSDPDCQAIINNKNNTISSFAVGNPQVQMQGIAMRQDALVSSQGYYVFSFFLTAQLINPQADHEDHHISVQIFYNGQEITASNATYEINFTVKKV